MNTKLKIGIIGAGARGVYGFGSLLNARDDVELGALMDINPTRMRKAVDVLGLKACCCYTSLSEMFAGQVLDGVVITTPDAVHEACAVEAIGHKVSVLIDKPLATTSRGCMNIIDAARKHGAQVMVGFNLRCIPVLMQARQMVQEGEIGRLMMIENMEFYDGGRTYMSRWNRDSKLSGGLWVHKGTHDFDVLNWLNPEGTPRRVSSFAGINAFHPHNLPFDVVDAKPVGPTCGVCEYTDVCPDGISPNRENDLFDAEAVGEDGYARDVCMYLSEKDTHDNGITIVEYDNNVRASHSECFAASFTDRQYTVTGDRGVLTFSTAHPETIILRSRWKRGYTTEIKAWRAGPGGHGGADPGVVGHFLNAIRTGDKQLASLRDGIRAVAVGEAAEISWREHRMVDIATMVDLQHPLIEQAI